MRPFSKQARAGRVVGTSAVSADFARRDQAFERLAHFDRFGRVEIPM
jgi:hypothetical protein